MSPPFRLMSVAAFILVMLAALPIKSGDEKPAAVKFSEDFSKNTLKDYQVKGDVTWQKGQLTLAAGAALFRKMVLGHKVEIRANVPIPSGSKEQLLFLSLQGKEGDFAQAGLGVRQERLVLVNLGEKQKPEIVTLQDKVERKAGQNWLLCLRLDYGVARAKAWPASSPDPGQWQSVRYTGYPLWEPSLLVAAAGKGAGATLSSLEVTGEPPAPPLSPECQAKAAKSVDLNNEAVLLANKGKYTEALARAREAVRLAKEGHGKEHPETANLLNTLGGLLRSRGQFQEARRHLEEALAINKKVLGLEHPQTALCLDVLALVQRDSGDYRAARASREQALMIFLRVLGPDHIDTAISLDHMAGLLKAGGEYAAARRYYERALATFTKLLGPQHPDTAICCNNLATLLGALGEVKAARQLFVQALTIYEDKLGADHPETLRTLSNLGCLIRDRDEWAAAQKYLERALDLRRKHLGEEHPDTAETHAHLGILFERQDKKTEARQHYDKALAIYEEALGPNHPASAWVVHRIGLLLWKQDELAQAEKLLLRALILTEKSLGEDHPQTAGILDRLGCLYASQKKVSPAWEKLARTAAASARRAGDLVAASAEPHHAALVSMWRSSLDRLLSLGEENPAVVEKGSLEMLTRVLEWKAVSSWTLMGRQEAIVVGNDPTVVPLYEQLRAVRYQLAQALLQGPGKGEVAKYRQTLAGLRKQQVLLEELLAEKVEDYTALRKHWQIGAEDIAVQLPAGAVLVEVIRYHRYRFLSKDWHKGWDRPRYAALLLWRAATDTESSKAKTETRFVPLGEAEVIDEAVHNWRSHVQDAGVNDKADKALRERVWRPLAKVLPKDTRQLLIAPDGELSLLPFEALRLADGKYLIENYQISYVSSGRDLVPRPWPRDNKGPGLILAAPDYDALGKPSVAQVDRTAPPTRSDDWTRSPKAFKSLPGFVREAESVAKLLKARGWDVKVLQADQASEERLAKVRRPRLLHFVTHGFFLPDLKRLPGKEDGLRELNLAPLGTPKFHLPPPGDDPRLRSGLALAGANRWKERSAQGLSDGLLTALEVENLDLWGTELVVLSACETGLGTVQVGEGVLGLRRAFQLAGAQTVLASLWKVPDAETEQLMTAFFQGWLKGAGKAQALRAAQLQLIAQLRASTKADRRTAPPLYWAGFICHGQAR
jgi:CHAT domain-containing protein/Tfp pilus assembly protein PilF